MSTYTNNSARFFPSAPTVTEVRNFLVDLYTGITSSGWTATSDTGQMDEATVTVPGTTGTVFGYRLYYLNDSYHSTNPILMKMVATTGSTTVNRIGISVSFGIASDGAGNFSGWSATLPSYNIMLATGFYYLSTVGSFLGSYGEGYSVLLIGRGLATGNAETPVISVQRAFNQQTGAVQDDGTFYVYLNQYSSAAFPASVQVTGYNRNYNQVVSTLGAMNYSKSFVPMGVGYSGANVEIYPDIFRARVANISPITGTYKITDVATDNYVTANILGTNRTYRATGVVSTNSAQSTTGYGLALIWE